MQNTDARKMNVVAIVVMSFDGCLTRHDQPGTAFASAADHAFFRAALQTFDCSLAGRRTFQAGRASMLRARDGTRLQLVLTSTPARFDEDAQPEHLEFRNKSVVEVLRELEARDRKRCALVGGSRLYTEAVAAGLVDELWITVEPIAFGAGVRIFDGPVDFRFELASSEVLSGSTVLLKYRRLS